MKRFIITEEEKSRILNLHSLASKKFVVSEAYEGGLVMQGDKICDIVCKTPSVYHRFFDKFYPHVIENFTKNYKDVLGFVENKIVTDWE